MSPELRLKKISTSLWRIFLNFWSLLAAENKDINALLNFNWYIFGDNCSSDSVWWLHSTHGVFVTNMRNKNMSECTHQWNINKPNVKDRAKKQWNGWVNYFIILRTIAYTMYVWWFCSLKMFQKTNWPAVWDMYDKKILRDDMGIDIYTMYICRSYLKIFQNYKKYI